MDDDMYVDKSDFMTPKISRNQLQMTDTLAEGRFAVVRRAYLDTGKDRPVVATKALRSTRYNISLNIMLSTVSYPLWRRKCAGHGNRKW